jgi:hypothetical protein
MSDKPPLTSPHTSEIPQRGKGQSHFECRELLAMAVRCLVIGPIILPLAMLSVFLDEPDALEAAGNLLSMWALGGKIIPCADILATILERGNVKLGVWLDRSRATASTNPTPTGAAKP